MIGALVLIAAGCYVRCVLILIFRLGKQRLRVSIIQGPTNFALLATVPCNLGFKVDINEPAAAINIYIR